jgi:hypothetical protein
MSRCSGLTGLARPRGASIAPATSDGKRNVNWQAGPQGTWAESRSGITPEALVILLSSAELASEACERLAEAWRSRLPAVTFVAPGADVIGAKDPGVSPRLLALIASELVRADLTPERLVLVCLGEAGSLGLRLATSGDQPCSGLLAIAEEFSPEPKSTDLNGLKLRLLCYGGASLGRPRPSVRELVRELEARGADIRASALDDAADLLAPSVIRLGGAYLADLVASALSRQRWCRHPERFR